MDNHLPVTFHDPILSSRVEIPASCRAKDIVRALWSTQGMETFPVLSLMRREESVSDMWAQHVARWSAIATSLSVWTSMKHF